MNGLGNNIANPSFAQVSVPPAQRLCGVCLLSFSRRMCIMKPGSYNRLRCRKSKASRGRLRTRPWFENLEERLVLSSIYSIDGTGNNLSDPSRFNWGSVGQDLLRVAPAAYGDGISTLAGQDRPSPRLISEVIVTDGTDGGTPNSRFMADWVYAWGQFIDHDIDLTSGGTGTQFQPANIPVPAGDPYFDPNNTGTQVINFNRSEFDPATGTDPGNPRQQINNITAFLDGSMIYGSDPVVADALRTHRGGKLKSSPGADGVIGTQDDLLPFNNHTYFPGISLDPNDPNAAFSIANDAHLVPDDQLFMAGDVRANENIELTAVHTLFLREHNRIAGLINAAYPFLNDETVFQAARAIVIAEVQSITFNEFLPALLGPNVIPAYQGYDPTINPDIATEFSTAGFRLGHSLLAPDVQFLNPNASTKFPAVSLANSFFNPPVLQANGADPILKYLATDNAQEIDNKIVPELQNFLFGPPGAGGFDLASLNIQRGRDHGLADYNTTRVAYGLHVVTSFDQVSSDPAIQADLQQLYGSVNNIDLWVGMLAEDHVPGGSVGPLIQHIVAAQFEHIRDGDRLWFEHQYSGFTLSNLEHTTLANILRRNTVNNDLQGNVFFFMMRITGTVFKDANFNGSRDPGEGGVGGRIIRLLDPSNTIVAQTTTAADGTYSFDNLANNLNPVVPYRVREVLPFGVIQTTFNPPSLTFTRGETFAHIDFGNFILFGGGGSSAFAPSSGTTGPADGGLVATVLIASMKHAASLAAGLAPIGASSVAAAPQVPPTGSSFSATVFSPAPAQASGPITIRPPGGSDSFWSDVFAAVTAGDPLATDSLAPVG
jgi:peroxidase